MQHMTINFIGKTRLIFRSDFAIKSHIYGIRLCSGNIKVNPSFKKEDSKVVHDFFIEDLGDRTCFCRCWRSSKFPICDGTHNKHNKESGDNVGPIIIKKKKEMK